MSNQMIKGNTAVVIGAMYAGCDCFFGYPITPASEILHEASKYFPMVGRNFVQAESEEASINMVYGASGAGHRVMTASSGPGISLMQEGFTFLAGAELPAVIVDIMRAGPGLGNIGPEQGDYNQIVKGGGHGNYKNIVLAPNSVQEMCDLTMKAFELADKWRNPVIVLADGTLGQMAEPLEFPTEAIKPSEKDWAVKGNKETMDNLITSIFNDFNDLEDFNYKLQEKYDKIEAEEVIFDEYKVEDITLSPFPTERIKELSDKGVSFISVEMSNGQLLADVQFAALRKEDTYLVNRMGGNIIELKQVLAKIYEICGIDEEIDTTRKSIEKDIPNIID